LLTDALTRRPGTGETRRNVGDGPRALSPGRVRRNGTLRDGETVVVCLITQRSRVQIPPPLLGSPGQRPDRQEAVRPSWSFVRGSSAGAGCTGWTRPDEIVSERHLGWQERVIGEAHFCTAHWPLGRGRPSEQLTEAHLLRRVRPKVGQQGLRHERHLIIETWRRGTERDAGGPMTSAGASMT
jgi:hypothetical protein